MTDTQPPSGLARGLSVASSALLLAAPIVCFWAVPFVGHQGVARILSDNQTSSSEAEHVLGAMLAEEHGPRVLQFDDETRGDGVRGVLPWSEADLTGLLSRYDSEQVPAWLNVFEKPLPRDSAVLLVSSELVDSEEAYSALMQAVRRVTAARYADGDMDRMRHVSKRALQSGVVSHAILSREVDFEGTVGVRPMYRIAALLDLDHPTLKTTTTLETRLVQQKERSTAVVSLLSACLASIASIAGFFFLTLRRQVRRRHLAAGACGLLGAAGVALALLWLPLQLI